MLGLYYLSLPEQSFVEGIGNELLLFLSILSLTLFFVFAWASTGVNWDVLPVRIRLVQPLEEEEHEAETAQNEDNSTASATAALPASLKDADKSDDSDFSDLSDSPGDQVHADGVRHRHTPDTGTEKSDIPKPIISSATVRHLSFKEQEAYAARFRPKGHLVLRIQYVDSRVRYVHAPPNMLVSRFKKKHFAEELSDENMRIRLIFQGRELTENCASTYSSPSQNRQSVGTADRLRNLRLCDFNVKDDSTIHCLTTSAPRRPVPPSSTESQQSRRTNYGNRRSTNGDPNLAEFDLGSRLMEPLFALLLGCAWFLRLTYRQYFNAVSTFALITLSVFFFGAVLAVNFMNFRYALQWAFRRRSRDSDRVNDSNFSSNSARDVRVVTVTMVARQSNRDQLNTTNDQSESITSPQGHDSQHSQIVSHSGPLEPALD